jgi:HlyD family secretion protein
MIRQDGFSMDQEVKGPRRWGWLFFLLLGLVFLIVTFTLLYPSISNWASADRSIDFSRIRTGVVTRGDLLRDVSVQGQIVAADHPTVVSPAQGVISILAKAGDVVTEGQALARIESPELRNQLKQEQSVLLSMQSELERLRLTSRQTDSQNQQQISLLEVRLRAGEKAVERARSLYEEKLTSVLDLEKAIDDLEIAKLELNQAIENAAMANEAAEFEIRSTELEQERQQLIVSEVKRKITELSVESPVSGMVSNIEVRDKDTVQPAQSLFSVVDLSEFEVEVKIPENFADEASTGTLVMIRYEDKEYPGEVKSLSPEVEDSQVKGIVTFGELSPSGLKQNQRVYTRLILESRPDVLRIPRGPFLESMGGRQVYVLQGDLAQLRSIEVGIVSVTEIEVLSGLEIGEEIILSNLLRFDGAETILLRR